MKIHAECYADYRGEKELRAITLAERRLGVVEILDRGGYVRYGYKTATKLLVISRDLLACHANDLNALHAAARDARELDCSDGLI